MAKKTIYYTDALHDDFANAQIDRKPVSPDFPLVINNIFWKIAEFIFYRIIATPLIFLISKIFFGLHIENRKAIKKISKTGFYMYGNHTQGIMDAYTPSLISFPKHNHIVVSPETVSIPFVRILVQLMGGIPIPDGLKGKVALMKALPERIKQKRSVTIYPEAHIWPYYTGIRPFSDVSFTYPVNDNVPVIAFVTTYRKRKLFPNLAPLLTVKVSDPFYTDKSLDRIEARKKLRDDVYNFMCKETSNPDNYAYYEYIQKDDENS